MPINLPTMNVKLIYRCHTEELAGKADQTPGSSAGTILPGTVPALRGFILGLTGQNLLVALISGAGPATGPSHGRAQRGVLRPSLPKQNCAHTRGAAHHGPASRPATGTGPLRGGILSLPPPSSPLGNHLGSPFRTTGIHILNKMVIIKGLITQDNCWYYSIHLF